MDNHTIAKQIAWMRRWAFDREEPKKERNSNGRMAWPFRFKLLPITEGQLLPDDVPLWANEDCEQGGSDPALAAARSAGSETGARVKDAIERLKERAQNEATCFALRDLLRDKDAEIRLLRDALEQCEHETMALRVWNGTEWSYSPYQAGRIAKIARAALTPND